MNVNDTYLNLISEFYDTSSVRELIYPRDKFLIRYYTDTFYCKNCGHAMVWCEGGVGSAHNITSCPVSYVAHYDKPSFHHLDDVIFEKWFGKEKCKHKFQTSALIVNFVPDHIELHLHTWTSEEKKLLIKKPSRRSKSHSGICGQKLRKEITERKPLIRRNR